MMASRVLDITGDYCPITFVKTKIALEKIQPGERLEVILREGEPLENVPRAAAGDGHRVVEIVEVRDGVYRVVIEKAGCQ